MAERVFTQTFGVVAAIIEKGGKFLLVQEAKRADAGLWSHPAGWIEVGEDPTEAVKREVREETGFDFMPTHVLGVYSLYKVPRGAHAIKVVFLGSISDTQKYLAEDVSATSWFSAEEIESMDAKTLRDEDIKVMIQHVLRGTGYPLELLSHFEQHRTPETAS